MRKVASSFSSNVKHVTEIEAPPANTFSFVCLTNKDSARYLEECDRSGGPITASTETDAEKPLMVLCSDFFDTVDASDIDGDLSKARAAVEKTIANGRKLYYSETKDGSEPPQITNTGELLHIKLSIA